MPYPRFEFVGHRPTKQNLQSEQEYTHIDTVGRWKRGEVHAVIPDIAEMLRMTRCFRELPADEVYPPVPVVDAAPAKRVTPAAATKTAPSPAAARPAASQE